MTDELRPGDLVVAGQTLGEPTALLAELFGAPVPFRLFTGMSLTTVLEDAPPTVALSTFVGLGSSARLLAAGRMELVPTHMSNLPPLLADGPLRPDVAAVLVSPPDTDGWCSLGLVSDYIGQASKHARVVLAEINEHVPRVGGDTAVHIDDITASIRTDRPLPSYERATPTDEERAIATNVAPFVRDGTCLQIGVGRLGEAVLAAVADRRDLGVHAGMVGDTLLELAAAGVVTGARKALDTGLTVAGSILGSARAVALAAADPDLRLRSIEHTHSAAVVARLGDFLCVGSAIEVDLFGQGNAEQVGGRYVGAVGGAVDFLRAAAASPEGRSVLALPATAKGGAVTRIVPRVERVTGLGTDVDAVVTEHGVAELQGCTEGERARRLIELAAPEHRDGLRAAAVELGL